MRFKQFIEAIEKQGIVTAYNPLGKTASDGYNSTANQKLEKDLDGECIVKFKGSYGGKEEEAFLIPKIGKKKIKELGQKYQQKSVIWDGKEIPVN